MSAMTSLKSFCCVINVQFLLLISISLTKASLTRVELREKYGQVGTSFNDGKDCYRTCDGQTKTCYYEFNAQYFDTMNSLCGDCESGTLSDCFNSGCIPGSGIERAIMVVNQKLPGQTINVCYGDRIIVDVTNHMPGQALTIHWHGIHQHKTPWMDGIAMVTQCPINSGNTFRYVFDATEKGTNFWHAHTGLHRMNGLSGALIVREFNDPNVNLYDFDMAEHTIVLTDFDNHIAEDKMPGVKSIITKPNSLLINGFGSLRNSTDSYKFAPMAVFYVQRGKRHRLRILDVGSHVCQLGITIIGHKLTVIASDGYPMEPFEVDSLATSPGERYDVVIDATNDPLIDETLLMVRTVESCDAQIQEYARIIFVDDVLNHPRKIEDHAPLEGRASFDSLFDGAKSKVTLNYPMTDCKSPGIYCIAAAQQKALSNSIGVNLRNVEPYAVIPLHFKMVPIHWRPWIYLDVDKDAKIATINRIANSKSPVPGLVQDDSSVPYCNADNLPERFDVALDNQTVFYCPQLIKLELDKVYELLLIDDTTDEPVAHPVHIHGHSFQIIDMGTLDQLNSRETPFSDAIHPPVRKDTVTLPKNGFVRARFRTDNPGYWLLHCHIEHHLPAGMTLIFKVGNKTDMRPPPLNLPKCGNHFTPIVNDEL